MSYILGPVGSDQLRSLKALPSAALLQLRKRAVGVQRTSGFNIGQTSPRVVDPQQVDARALQAVVVVRAVSVDHAT